MWASMEAVQTVVFLAGQKWEGDSSKGNLIYHPQRYYQVYHNWAYYLTA